MSKSKKHNSRAKKLKARKAAHGSVISNYRNPVSSAYAKLAHASFYGADCVIDLTGSLPRTFIKCGDTWIEDHKI